MPNEAASHTLSVESFRRKLKEEIDAICHDRGWQFSNNKNRGTAFQLWTAQLLCEANGGLETKPDDAVVETRDLHADVVLQDATSERLIIAQCKAMTLTEKPAPIAEQEITAFCACHKRFMDRNYVRRYGSSQAVELLREYGDLHKQGYTFQYYFVTTGVRTHQVTEIIERQNREFAESGASASVALLDLHELKEFYLRTKSLQGEVGVPLEEVLQEGSFFVRQNPYKTLVCAIKANTLRAIYNRGGAKERIFALNIRDWLGKRTGINKDIVRTAELEAENFFYYNNGISAVCTSLSFDPGSRKLRAENFQVINGAQTVGALVDAPPNDDVYVLMRITESSGSKSHHKQINDKIIRYNNSQNVVKVSDFCSNDEIQVWLEAELARRGAKTHLPKLTYQRKRNASTRVAKGATLLRLEELGKLPVGSRLGALRPLAPIPRVFETNPQALTA